MGGGLLLIYDYKFPEVCRSPSSQGWGQPHNQKSSQELNQLASPTFYRQTIWRSISCFVFRDRRALYTVPVSPSAWPGTGRDDSGRILLPLLASHLSGGCKILLGQQHTSSDIRVHLLWQKAPILSHRTMLCFWHCLLQPR